MRKHVENRTIGSLYSACAECALPGDSVSRPKIARNSPKSSPVAAARINEVRKRIIMIDDENEDLP